MNLLIVRLYSVYGIDYHLFELTKVTTDTTADDGDVRGRHMIIVVRQHHRALINTPMDDGNTFSLNIYMASQLMQATQYNTGQPLHAPP